MPQSGLSRIVLPILAALAIAGIALTIFERPSGDDEAQNPQATDIQIRFAGDDAGDGVGPAVLVQDFGPDARPRNVVLFLGDGVGFQQILAARLALQSLDRPLTLETMPVTGWSTTYAVGGLLTDSAAGATALATGYKAPSGAIGVDRDGVPRETVAELARDAGMSVGLLTDTKLWDASPAAFAAHRESRRDVEGIVDDMAASGFDVLIGGGAGEGVGEGEDDAAQHFADAGYRVAKTAAELEAADPDDEVVALFPDGAIAEGHDGLDLPNLATLAFDRLAARDTGFFLLVETEETDTGSHRHNLPRTIAGIDSLNRAVEAMLARAVERRDTLILFTADHETGGFVLHAGKEGEPLEISWTTRYHSGAPVPVLAYGPGAERFGGVTDNTDIGQRLRDLLAPEASADASAAGARPATPAE